MTKVLSRVIEQGLSFVSLAVVEVMTLLGDVGYGNNGYWFCTRCFWISLETVCRTAWMSRCL